MLPSSGARWSRAAVRTGNFQGNRNCSTPRLLSRGATHRAQESQGIPWSSSKLQHRHFSSSQSQKWSLSSLWANPNAQTTVSKTSSEFATASTNQFASYQDPQRIPAQPAPTQGLIEESVPPTPAPINAAPEHLAAENVAPSHHGSPLVGPEKLIPDPVTHPSSDLTTPIEYIPEHIGYLKELGLDYGWGTSTPMQDVLEYIHIYAGIPWYASAMVAALLVRLCFVGLQIKSSDSSAKWQALKHIHEPLTAEMKAARLEGDSFKAAQLTQQLLALRKEANLTFPAMVIPIVGQITFGFGIWRNLRGMAELPIPALEHESFLWMNDLSVRDHTFAIAFLQAVSMYSVMSVCSGPVYLLFLC